VLAAPLTHAMPSLCPTLAISVKGPKGH
jgi:hypothetical protein